MPYTVLRLNVSESTATVLLSVNGHELQQDVPISADTTTKDLDAIVEPHLAKLAEDLSAVRRFDASTHPLASAIVVPKTDAPPLPEPVVDTDRATFFRALQRLQSLKNIAAFVDVDAQALKDLQAEVQAAFKPEYID